MRFVATVSFSTSGAFNSEKDDREVNDLLESLQRAGAELLNITVRLAGREMGATALYVIEYEAPSPIKISP